MELSHYQIDILAEVRHGSSNILVKAGAGSGKCLGKGTPVLLYNGKVIPVERVQEGDLLMGPDSKPREVLSTSVGNGPLYRVRPVKGDPWVCNGDHLLVLTGTNRDNGKKLVISVEDYLQICRERQGFYTNWKLVRTCVDFSFKENLPYDPYFIGVWIGDGTTGQASITSPDKEILRYLKYYGEHLGYKVNFRREPRNEKPLYLVSMQLKTKYGKGKPGNSLRRFLRTMMVNARGEKRIPLRYMRASRKNRLRLLAGILDTDGYLSGNYYSVSSKWYGLAKQYAFLARSLGLAAYISEKWVQLPSMEEARPYYFVSISGEVSEIPCLIKRKQATKRKQIKRVTVTGFTLEFLGRGKYYGFTLDGDGEFLLGDFTITHNTKLLELTMGILSQSTSACLMAFSKAIAEELTKRMPSHCYTSTINSAGYTATRMALPFARFDQGKTHKILMEMYPDANRDVLYQVKRLVSLGKAYGYGYHSGKQYPLEPATEDSWKWLLTRHALDIDAEDQDEAIEMADNVLWENNQNTAAVDYDDQVYFPVIFNYRTPKYDFVGLDELQDLSSIQRVFVEKLVTRSGRVMGVGDEKQSVMSFRGANADSMRIFQHEFACKSLPLSITYRCPKKVVQEANVFVPELESAPWAEEGKILRPQVYDANLFKHIQNGVILCRNNAPLMLMAIRLLKNKIRFYMQRHGDFVQALKNFVLKFKAKNLVELFQKIGRWEHKQLDKCFALGQEMKAQYITDKCSCVQFLAKEVSTVEALLQLLDAIFAQTGNITLGTIHSLKGKEFDDVFFLDKFLIPSKYAKQSWQIQQERNVAYVGITRTKKRLHYLSSLGFGD